MPVQANFLPTLVYEKGLSQNASFDVLAVCQKKSCDQCLPNYSIATNYFYYF